MIDSNTFRPAWWLRSGHLQTIWPAQFRNVNTSETYKERLTTEDGDFVDLDWCGDPPNPIVILLHGLTGCSQSSYIKGIQQALLQAGLRSVALNFRGCSGQPNLKAGSYHSGETGDVHHLYLELKRREPQTAIAAVGYSLGGNVLLKWLGEQGGGLSLFAAVAVSVPFQLNLCADQMDRGFSRVYRNRLVRDLKNSLQQKLEFFEENDLSSEARKIMALGDLSKVHTFWEFDDRVIASLFAFEDVHDYYRQSSSRQYLRAITVPTLLIQSVDDPFMTPDVIPSTGELSPAVSLEVTEAGGHVGFVAGNIPGKPEYWLEQRIPRFLQQQLMRLKSEV